MARLNSMRRHQAGQGGFSLLELAVVLTVIGLVMGAMTPFMASLIRNARANSMRESMNLITDVLADYAARHQGCLPYAAAMDGDIQTAVAGGSGISDIKGKRLAGELPWATLGIGRPRDAATSPYRYVVAAPVAGADCPGRGFGAAAYGDDAAGFPKILAGPDDGADMIAARAAVILISPGSDNALGPEHKLTGPDSGRWVLVRSGVGNDSAADTLRFLTPVELRVMARRFGEAR